MEAQPVSTVSIVTKRASLQPGMSLEGMTEMCTAILKDEGMDEESARSMLRNQLPFLKRWRTNTTDQHAESLS